MANIPQTVRSVGRFICEKVETNMVQSRSMSILISFLAIIIDWLYFSPTEIMGISYQTSVQIHSNLRQLYSSILVQFQKKVVSLSQYANLTDPYVPFSFIYFSFPSTFLPPFSNHHFNCFQYLNFFTFLSYFLPSFLPSLLPSLLTSYAPYQGIRSDARSCLGDI